eukprot:9956381-Ditylum_brightwellii.AAC.1
MECRKLGGKTRKAGVYKEVRKEVESGCTGDQIQSAENTSKTMNHWLTVAPYRNNNSVLGEDESWDI